MGSQAGQPLFGGGPALASGRSIAPMFGGAPTPVNQQQNTTSQFRREQEDQTKDQSPKGQGGPSGILSSSTGQGGGRGSFTPPPGQMPRSGPAGGMPSGPYGPMRGGLKIGTSPWGANNRFK